MVLDQAGPAGECQNLVVADGKARSVRRRTGTFLRHLPAADVVDQLEFLVAQPLLQDRPEAAVERGLEDVVFVRIHRALHDVFAQAVGRVDEHGVLKAGFGVDREHHARSARSDRTMCCTPIDSATWK